MRKRWVLNSTGTFAPLRSPRPDARSLTRARSPVRPFVRQVECIKTKGKVASIGDIITCSVKKTSSKGKVEQGQVVKAVVVETRKEIQRADGSVIKFDKNSCVLVNSKGLPIGTRVLGFVTHELRSRNMLKVLSLAARVF